MLTVLCAAPDVRILRIINRNGKIVVERTNKILGQEGQSLSFTAPVIFGTETIGSAKAVLLGDFDGGIMKDTIYEKFAPQGLRVVYTSPSLASYVFVVNGELDAATQTKLKDAFMALNQPTPEAVSILKTLDQGYDGFQPSTDKDYDRERKLIARVKKENMQMQFR
ncbi:hypothetical protein TPL01_08340 [Sulfuriferula plumbiphila]|uniref:Uncharacterized protein n=1 Tax=Sulfuriferula plumbiphila TaxID=171865 RepID=A0A512L5D1_9PROT|nr:PhnD/SsuA/transferrin family substrate-binding protein [Sulfuriferula plumbiphila]BBP03533.1 hypothetical protein SFPGR_09550 [Sulfuriferula plumbiphila]GEP29696.1 hypothetical protein TPL01_08340 [Sulfuriferula plumbiphila]